MEIFWNRDFGQIIVRWQLGTSGLEDFHLFFDLNISFGIISGKCWKIAGILFKKSIK